MSIELEARIEKVLKDLDLYKYYTKEINALDDYISLNFQNPEYKPVIRREFRPKAGSIKLVPLFDIHYGLKGCNVRKLKSYVDFILRTDDCYSLLGGDSCETATRESIGLGLIEEELHTGDQRRELINILRPLAKAKKILCGVTGNHEFRARRFNGDDPMEEICYDLGVEYCSYQAYLDLWVNDISYHVVVHHGIGSASTKGGIINAATKPGNLAVGDLFISGHSHVRAAFDDAVYMIDDTSASLVKRRRVFVIGGSLVNYFGLYSEMKLLQPSIQGAVLISLSGSSKYVSVTL